MLTFLFSAVAVPAAGPAGPACSTWWPAASTSRRKPESKRKATDELSVMASKVSLLGQRLRGAQFEVSDLRGNIDRLLQDLEDAVFIFNRERRLVFASGSVEKFLGQRARRSAGAVDRGYLPAGTTLGLLVAQAAQTGRPLRNRRVPLAPGAKAAARAVVLLSVDLLETVPGSARCGAGLLVRLRDPEAQRKLGRELQTADRLAAISRISSGVAHEVKNPLNAILLHVEVARAKLARGDTDVEPQMEIISREILRLDRVVKTFLDFTRPVELKLANVPLADLMGEIVELARPQADAAQHPRRGGAGGRGRGGAGGPRPVETGRAERGGERHAGHAGGRRAALRSAGQRRHGRDPHLRYRRAAFPRSCARRSSGSTSPPRRKARASAWR